MRIFWENGIVVSNGSKLCIDPSKKPCCPTIVSHAHSDHSGFSCKGSELLMHEHTLNLLPEKFSTANACPISYGKKVRFAGFDVSLHSSCHMLGSSQILLEGKKTVAVTTDFQMQESLLLPKAEPLKCDVLVIESTFGLPSFDFPEREQVYVEIGKWIEGNAKKNTLSVLCGYALGKAQELTKIVSQYTKQVPFVHEKIFEFNSLYERQGMKLGDFLEAKNNLKEASVLIIPPSLVEKNFLQALSISSGKRVSAAMATGWNYRGCFDKVFPLSDHADFKQIIDYVKQSEPRIVFTEHGYARELAGHIRRKAKIPAKPLEEKGQSSMAEYI